MGNLSCFALQYVLGTPTARLKELFPAEYKVMQEEPAAFEQSFVVEYRALAATYHTSLAHYEVWCDPTNFQREALPALREFECDVMLQSQALSEFLKSRGDEDLREFLNRIVDRHNVLAPLVYEEMTCGLPFELFRRLTRCVSLTPLRVSQALFIYRNKVSETNVWFRDELLDIDVDHMIGSDAELSKRLILLTGSKLSSVPLNEKFTREYDAYLERVNLKPRDLLRFPAVYALRDLDGGFSDLMKDYLEQARIKDIDIKPIWRTAFNDVVQGGLVIGDDYSYLFRMSGFQPKINFGGMNPIPIHLEKMWLQRKKPNLYIVRRY